ncbi:MAG: hypothetical protein A4E19_00260 [Nitrospira sp. SG-bin1]|nr:MAG: hypothetical protein A4E19_00260 [Nitrospira sp. SG-bin1]
MRFTSFHARCLASLVMITAACASPRVIPESLEPLVDRTVTFREVVTAPDSYQGKIVVFGGEVLKAKRLKDGTQIELLQLPLDKGERPVFDRQQSQGRFLAIQQEFLDPATIAAGTSMTIVGELSKAKVEHLDDVEYRYPVVIVKYLHAWPARSEGAAHPYPSPRFSIGIGGGTGGRIGGGGGFGIGF